MSSSPGIANASPVRNGRTSTSPLRATMSPPTTTSAAGATYAPQPISASVASATAPPTTPPSQSR